MANNINKKWHKELQFTVTMNAKSIGNWKRFRKHRSIRRIIFSTVLNVRKPHPACFENTAILLFEIEIIEIPEEKLSNIAIPQTLMSPSIIIWVSLICSIAKANQNMTKSSTVLLFYKITFIILQGWYDILIWSVYLGIFNGLPSATTIFNTCDTD